MTASIATRTPFATLDERISRALLVLRQARLAATRSPGPEARRLEERAEQNLNALLDYRYSVRHRSE